MAKPESKKPEAEGELPAFERSLEELEGIVHAIESGEVTLEQSLKEYERGTRLIQHCRAILGRAETQIKTLTADEKGKVKSD